MLRTAAILAAFILAAGHAEAEPPKAAVFDIKLIYTSTPLVQPTPTEKARLAMLSERLRKELQEAGKFDVVDTAPVADEAAHSNLDACGGCDRRMARQVGADVAVIGAIYKMSDLILNLSIVERDVESGKITHSYNVDFRGNTDESWMRSLDWILKHRVLTNEATQ